MKNNRAQSIIEFVSVIILVTLGIYFAAPTVIRGFNAHFKIFDDSIQDSYTDPMKKASINATFPVNCVCDADFMGTPGQRCGVGPCEDNEAYYNKLCNPVGCGEGRGEVVEKCVPDRLCCSDEVDTPNCGVGVGNARVDPTINDCPVGDRVTQRGCGPTTQYGCRTDADDIPFDGNPSCVPRCLGVYSDLLNNTDPAIPVICPNDDADLTLAPPPFELDVLGVGKPIVVRGTTILSCNHPNPTRVPVPTLAQDPDKKCEAYCLPGYEPSGRVCQPISCNREIIKIKITTSKKSNKNDGFCKNLNVDCYPPNLCYHDGGDARERLDCGVSLRVPPGHFTPPTSAPLAKCNGSAPQIRYYESICASQPDLGGTQRGHVPAYFPEAIIQFAPPRNAIYLGRGAEDFDKLGESDGWDRYQYHTYDYYAAPCCRGNFWSVNDYQFDANVRGTSYYGIPRTANPTPPDSAWAEQFWPIKNNYSVNEPKSRFSVAGVPPQGLQRNNILDITMDVKWYRPTINDEYYDPSHWVRDIPVVLADPAGNTTEYFLYYSLISNSTIKLPPPNQTTLAPRYGKWRIADNITNYAAQKIVKPTNSCKPNYLRQKMHDSGLPQFPNIQVPITQAPPLPELPIYLIPNIANLLKAEQLEDSITARAEFDGTGSLTGIRLYSCAPDLSGESGLNNIHIRFNVKYNHCCRIPVDTRTVVLQETTWPDRYLTTGDDFRGTQGQTIFSAMDAICKLASPNLSAFRDDPSNFACIVAPSSNVANKHNGRWNPGYCDWENRSCVGSGWCAAGQQAVEWLNCKLTGMCPECGIFNPPTNRDTTFCFNSTGCIVKDCTASFNAGSNCSSIASCIPAALPPNWPKAASCTGLYPLDDDGAIIQFANVNPNANTNANAFCKALGFSYGAVTENSYTDDCGWVLRSSGPGAWAAVDEGNNNERVFAKKIKCIQK